MAKGYQVVLNDNRTFIIVVESYKHGDMFGNVQANLDYLFLNEKDDVVAQVRVHNIVAVIEREVRSAQAV